MHQATAGRRNEGARTADLLPLLVLAVIWGGSLPAIKLGLGGIPPLTLTFLRYLCAAPLFVWSLRGAWPAVRRAWRPLAALACLNAIPGQMLQTLGLHYTTATAGTLLTSTIPLWFVLLGSRRLGQRLGARAVIGLAAAALGVGVIAVGDPLRISDLWRSGLLLGNALELLSAVCVALYYALSADVARSVSPLVAAGGTSVLALPFLLPFSLWELGRAPVHLTALGIGVVLYLGVGVTWLGLQIWLQSLQRVPAAIAGALQYLQPVVGVSLAALILGEAIRRSVVFGAVLVLVGIALATRRPASSSDSG